METQETREDLQEFALLGIIELYIFLKGSRRIKDNVIAIMVFLNDFLLSPPEASTQEEEEEAQEAPYKPPESKIWISLGSEVEIEDESVKDHRQKISRIRREFGAPVKFSDHSAVKEKENYAECPSYPDKTFNIKQMEKNAGIQAIPMLVEASTQTKWKYPKNACTQYSAQEFSDEEKQKLFTSKSLKDFINSVSIRFEIALQQNEIMNAFIDDWKVLGEEESSFGGKSDTHLKEYQSFTDLHFSKNKAVSFVNWHPSIPVPEEVRVEIESRVIFQFQLFHTKPGFEDPHANDTPVMRYCAVSSIEGGHKAPVTDVQWLPDYYEVALPKLDGGGEYSPMKFSLVDSHRDTWMHGSVDKFHPKTEKLEGGIDYATLRVPSAKNLKGQSDVSTKFSLGTEDGELVYADWKMEKDNDTGKLSTRQHLLAVSDEQGTVYILEIPWTIRHPSNNEKTSVSNYFEREVKHLEYFEARKLFREKEKREMEADEQKRKTEAVPPEKTTEQLEMERKTEYEEYLEMEKKILIQVGILQEAEEPLPAV
ncbi:WDR63 protein, partial [Polypterus senegalus]